MGMDQYLLIPFFSGMNIHESQLFWCELQGYQGFDPSPYDHTYIYIHMIVHAYITYIHMHVPFDELHLCTCMLLELIVVLARWICDERFIYHCDISCDGLHGLHLPHGMAQISQALHATLSTLPSGPSSWVSQSGSDGRWGLKQHTHSGILVLKSFIVGGLYFSPVPSCTYLYIYRDIDNIVCSDVCIYNYTCLCTDSYLMLLTCPCNYEFGNKIQQTVICHLLSDNVKLRFFEQVVPAHEDETERSFGFPLCEFFRCIEYVKYIKIWHVLIAGLLAIKCQSLIVYARPSWCIYVIPSLYSNMN